MARTIILFGLISVIVVTGGMFLPGLAIHMILASSGEANLATRQQALASTVQIILLSPVLDEQGQPVIMDNGAEQQMQFQTGEGLGTLARMNDEWVIVTHDHWTLLNAQLAKARFYNANNDLLVEVSGADFLDLIRSRDGGTMLLAAPVELVASSGLVAAEIEGGQAARWGETVAVVYRRPGTWELDVKVMAIRETGAYLGQNSYVLQGSKGTVVVPGNSGGGIWQNGRLIGNMWTTIQYEDGDSGNLQATSLSRAAQLSAIS